MQRKALIVEDDPDLAEVLATYLVHWGFDPAVLTQGRPAAAWARAHRPALILLDLMLPDVDGYDICQELKLDRATNLIPIIMVTGRSEPEDRVRGLRVGANAYLPKPFQEDQLHDLVTRALAWRDRLQAGGTEGEIHFELRSETRHLEELNQLLASLFHFTPLSEAQIRQLTLAIRELGANAIEWGHRNQVNLPVLVTYHIDAEKVTILIRDTGGGFDPERLPHAARADAPLEHLDVREARGLREGGFGILLARGLVDRLEYNATGNEARLVKYFAGPGPGEAGVR
jgi:DNA-binding response OmpR family regulator